LITHGTRPSLCRLPAKMTKNLQHKDYGQFGGIGFRTLPLP